MINNKRLSNVELSYFTATLGELLMSDGRIVNSYSYEKGTEDLPAPTECVGLRKWTDEDGAIKSKKTIPYEIFSDSDFEGLVESIKELEGL